MIWALLAPAFGASGASEPQPVRWDDSSGVFAVFGFDTGYWPSASDPIAVRFHVSPSGGVVTELDATSEIEWTSALHHRLTGHPSGGWLGVDTSIDIEAEVLLDIFGLYSGTVDLWSRTVELEAGTTFDGLLLPGAAQESAEIALVDPGLLPALDYAIPVIPGLSLVLGVELYPELLATLSGVSVRSEVGDVDLEQLGEGDWVTLPPDPGRPGELGVVSSWTGQLDSVLSLVIEPEVELDTILGPFTLVAFPIPVDLVDTSEQRELGPTFLVHPLPVLGEVADTHDFGDVEPGQLANWAVPLENLGQMLLSGTAAIEGDAAFTVFPDQFAVAADGSDGVLVTFSPSSTGAAEATLVLQSNDPTLPEIRIALAGNGAVFVEEGERDAVSLGSDAKGCGCEGSRTSGARPAGLALLLMAAARRRTARCSRSGRTGTSA